MHDEGRDHQDERDRAATLHGDAPAERESERQAAKSGGGDQPHTNHTPPGRFKSEDLSESMSGRDREERGEVF